MCVNHGRESLDSTTDLNEGDFLDFCIENCEHKEKMATLLGSLK